LQEVAQKSSFDVRCFAERGISSASGFARRIASNVRFCAKWILDKLEMSLSADFVAEVVLG
jgi:hypothetical protein